MVEHFADSGYSIFEDLEVGNRWYILQQRWICDLILAMVYGHLNIRV